MLFLCVHLACVVCTNGGMCVCVWQLALSASCHKEAVTAGVWPGSHLPARLTALHLHPYSLACPATWGLWPSLSLDLHCIWVWSAMETCSAQLEAAASWASPPFFHPSSLALPHPSLFLSSGFTLQHPTIRASLTPVIMPRWWAHCLWCVDGSSDLWLVSSLHSLHTHPCYCIYTYQDRLTNTGMLWWGVHPLPCQMLCFVSGPTSWFGPNGRRK